MLGPLPLPEDFGVPVRGQVIRLRPSLLPSPFREALCVTIAAQIGTLPVVALGFHLLPGVGPLANTLVLPLLPVLILLGALLGLSSGVPVLAAPLAALASALLRLTIWIATHLATLPGLIPLATVASIFTLTYYLFLAAAAFVVLHMARSTVENRRIRSREMVLSLSTGAALLTASLPQIHHRIPDQIRWLGAGNSIVLESRDRIAVIDGSKHPFTFLERLGAALPLQTHFIDLLVVTDPRASNIAGLDALLAHCRVGEVLDAGVEYPSETYARWRADLRRQHVPVFTLRTRTSVAVGDIRLTAIGPDALYYRPQDSAGMLRLSASGRTILLAGAASAREQLEAVFRPVDLKADTLVLGGKGYSDKFIRAVGARRILLGGATAGPPAATRLRAREDLLVPARR